MEEDYKLAKWLNDELSEKEIEALQQDPDFKLLEKIKQHSSYLKAPDFDAEKVLKNVLQADKTVKTRKLHNNWIVQIAAVVIIGIAFYFTFSTLNTTTFTSKNTIAQRVLPDASEVELNRNSRVVFSRWNWDNDRNVMLTGEAFFKVAKGEKFTVKTEFGSVSVLGTQFNVKTKDNFMEVSCYEGKVSVKHENQEFILTKGMVVQLDNKKTIQTRTALTKPNWDTKAIEFEFQNATIATMLTMLNEKYNVLIVLRQPITSQFFSGKLPADNLDVALQIIASTYHLKVNKQDTSNYELVKE
jgi:ferric-dicitrate binding protein FerR (iron transport regulator)